MYKLYRRNELRFAVLCITVYCIVTIPIRGKFGDESLVMFLSLAVIAAVITAFIKQHHLKEKYGLNGWPQNCGRYFYFIPIWILATGNLWGGVHPAYEGFSQLWAVLSMMLIGYIEEVIFRGFLFKGILERDETKKAVVFSAVTFGIGHIVNLFARQANLETVMQVFFAIAWGFIFTAVFYKSKSLLPCALGHGIVNSLDKYGTPNITMQWVYVIATIVAAAAYCPFLFKLSDEKMAALSRGETI